MIPFVPFSPAADDCRQSPSQRRKTNRFALVLFTLAAAAGLLVKYLA